MATGTSVSAYSDDEGSVVSTGPAAGSPNPGNVTVSSQSKRPNAQVATSGTYKIDGYALTLHYGNGTIERRPSFFWDAKKDSIWLGDSTLSKEK